MYTLRERKPSFDDPGDSDSLIDPGRFSLQIRTDDEQLAVDTSFDSVSTPSTVAERQLRKLVLLVRSAAGGILCGNADFYGIAFER